MDKPDIQQIPNSIGVEVTGTLIQRIRYGVAQFSDLYGKPMTAITAKKKKQLIKNEVSIKTDEEGIIKFTIPAAVWGSGNDTKKAFENKLEKLNDVNYKIFNENNLFLFAEGEEDYEVQELFNYIKSVKKIRYIFDNIYLYTYKELYSISIHNLTFNIVHITEEQKLEFMKEAAKFADTSEEKS